MSRERWSWASVAALVLVVLLPGFARAAEPSPGMELEESEKSPTSAITVEFWFDKTSQRHEVWLAPKDRPADRVRLYEITRHVTVLFSPDEKWLVVNDYWGSDIAEPHLFRRAGGVRYAEMKSADIAAKAWQFFARTYHLGKPPAYGHAYVEVLRWASDSRTLLVNIWGHNNEPDSLDPWLCVFDIDTLQPSLDLRLMNRGAFHRPTKKDNKPH